MYAGGQESRTPPQTNGSGSSQRSQPTFLRALYQKTTPNSFRHMPMGCISVIRAALCREHKSVMRSDYRQDRRLWGLERWPQARRGPWASCSVRQWPRAGDAGGGPGWLEGFNKCAQELIRARGQGYGAKPGVWWWLMGANRCFPAPTRLLLGSQPPPSK